MSVEFDPSSAAFARDPYAVYRELRSLGAPLYFEDADMLLLSRFRDVEAAARNANLVRTTDAFHTAEEQKALQIEANWHDMPNHEKFVQFSLLDSDGPVHDRLRRIVMKHMSRRFVEAQRGMIESFVSSLLNELIERRETDFIAEVACHVPGHIIGSILGVPDEDCAQLRVWSENVVQYFDIDRSDEKKALAEQATTEFFEYLTDLIQAREQHPRNDLISALITERDQGDMNETELVSTAMLILMAGHGSTIDVLDSGLLQLLKSPEQLELLRNHPALMPHAVQEMFRFEAPLPFFHRYANQTVEVMGQSYPAGTKFGLLYGSANRDPLQFDDADQFRIDRSANRHIAFGRGAHLCLGNHLSRIDMEVIFKTLLERVRRIELLQEPTYRTGLASRGLIELNIALTPN
jgi:cytochrome P450